MAPTVSDTIRRCEFGICMALLEVYIIVEVGSEVSYVQATSSVVGCLLPVA